MVKAKGCYQLILPTTWQLPESRTILNRQSSFLSDSQLNSTTTNAFSYEITLFHHIIDANSQIDELNAKECEAEKWRPFSPRGSLRKAAERGWWSKLESEGQIL